MGLVKITDSINTTSSTIAASATAIQLVNNSIQNLTPASIGAVPTSRKINGYPLTGDITLPIGGNGMELISKTTLTTNTTIIAIPVNFDVYSCIRVSVYNFKFVSAPSMAAFVVMPSTISTSYNLSATDSNFCGYNPSAYSSSDKMDTYYINYRKGLLAARVDSENDIGNLIGTIQRVNNVFYSQGIGSAGSSISYGSAYMDNGNIPTYLIVQTAYSSEMIAANTTVIVEGGKY